MSTSKDWRLRGQEQYLEGATLVLKPYRAWSEEWEHDHCEFCLTKFMDPSFSPEHGKFVADNPEVLTEGYAVLGRIPNDSSAGAMGRVYADDKSTIQPKVAEAGRTDYWWVCPTCVRDFAERFRWVVLSGQS